MVAEPGIVTVLGLGEVGSLLSGELRSLGFRTESYDPAFSVSGSPAARNAEALGLPADVTVEALHPTPALVVSAVTPGSCVEAAREAAPLLGRGAWFLDLNSASPGHKIQAADLVERAGGRYVEAALMSAIRPRRLSSPFVLGGPHAEQFALVAPRFGLDRVSVDPGPLGHAAATKLARSVVIKGLEALFTESLLAARHHGVEDVVLDSLSNLLPDADWAEVAAYFLERTLRHGVRRGEEMNEAAAMVRETGVEPVMSSATAERQAMTGALRARVDEAADLAALIDLLRPSATPHIDEETRS
jgi:3-hydroxyisobutyrate dehydrogenase-like beta-hydroxyacid dehydrogenase